MQKERAEITYENTRPGSFVRRINRFTAEILIDGHPEIVHVKNTGRLGELLLPGAEVTLQKVDHPKRKTQFDLISVCKPGLDWVNIDSLAPNALVRKWLLQESYDEVRPEYTYGGSRLDFYMKRGPKEYLMEIKGCTLASERQQGVGLFPDAPTERGLKHIRELAKAAEEGYSCTIAFVIQMNGILRVSPNDDTQPEFGRELIAAAKAGVHIAAYSCQVEADRIWITGQTDDTVRYCRTTQ